MQKTKLTLQKKLLASLLIAGLLPLLIASVIIDSISSTSLKEQAFNQLISVRDIKKNQVEQYFDLIRAQVVTLSENSMIVNAMQEFNQSFHRAAEDVVRTPDKLDEYKARVNEYYKQTFAAEYERLNGKPIDTSSILPDDANVVLSQYRYIVNNPNPLGSKQKLDFSDDGNQYSYVHARYHPVIRDYLEKFGYYDIFLIDPETGHIVYTVFKELDFATSLTTGPFKDSNLALAFRQVVNSGSRDAVFIADFKHYLPSYDGAASFIASPIYQANKLVGVLAFQMPVDRINHIMLETSGMGKSGESFLIGDDFLMRSQDRFESDNTVLKTKIDSEASRAAFSNRTDAFEEVSYRGVSALAAFTPLSIPGLKWAIITEIDKAEALSAITHLHLSAGVVAAVSLVLILILALLFARSVKRQLGGDPTEIEAIAQKIADGDLSLDTDRHDSPVGVYASMMRMRENLTSAIEGDIQQIVNSARAGDLTQRVTVEGKSGFYEQLATGVNDLVAVSQNIVDDSVRVFSALSEGNLSETYNRDYQGSFNQLKQDANATIEKIRQIIEGDIQSLVAAASQGDISKRIDLSDKQGFFREMSAGINQLVESVESIFEDASSVVRSMAKGDLTRKIENRYSGRFDDLKQDINATLEKLDQTIIGLREAGEIINSSAQEIRQGNSDLSERTEQQASALEETSSTMQELTSTVKNNADNTSQAEVLSEQTRTVAIKGGEVMQEASRAMDAINQSSQRIAEIIGVIDEIAFQTNLLALNASVEAARAGEQGRGFAVVATEVRNLAGRSATAAREIKELINDSVSKVETGVALVNQSGENLQEIVKSVTHVGSIVSEISSASHEQSAGIDQVNIAVSNMEELTQQNAALAEQTSAAAISMSDQTAEMFHMLEFFSVSKRSASKPRSGSVSAPAVAKKPLQSIPKPAVKKEAPKPVDYDDDEWEEF